MSIPIGDFGALIMAKDKFWMVLGNGVPVYRHPSKHSAITEAERLAMLNPFNEFVVLESLAICKKTSVSWEPTIGNESDTEGASVPF